MVVEGLLVFVTTAVIVTRRHPMRSLVDRTRRLCDHGGAEAKRYGFRSSSARIMPSGIAAARTPRASERRSRSAVGATAGRIQRAGTSRNAGHWRRVQATIRSSNHLSIAALSPLAIARGYAEATAAASHANPRPRRRASGSSVVSRKFAGSLRTGDDRFPGHADRAPTRWRTPGANGRHATLGSRPRDDHERAPMSLSCTRTSTSDHAGRGVGSLGVPTGPAVTAPPPRQ